MFIQLSDYLSAYVLPSGRAVFAGRKVVAAAQELGTKDIAKRANAFLDAANATHDLEIRYRLAQATPQYGPAASTIDARLDRALGALQRMVAGYVELSEDATTDPEMAAAARQLSNELFPRGLTHVTMMSFPEEFETVSKLLARLQGSGDLAGAAARLSLDPFVATLATLNTSFGAELDRAPKVEGPGWDEIRAARAKMHARQLELIAAVLGAFPDSDETSLTRRTAVLEPLSVQQRALAALYRSRRGGRDVNPETGEVDPTTPEEPVSPPQA